MIREAGIPEGNILAAGTSAIRESEDGIEFIARIKAATGLDARILDGKTEAAMTAAGVLTALPTIRDAYIIDIGGGSTESVAVVKGRAADSLSVATGVVKLVDRHLRSDPPSRDDLDSLSKAVSAASEKIFGFLGPLLPKDAECIGTAGTPTTLAAIDLGLELYDRERVSGHSISMDRLKEICMQLAGMNALQRRGVKGLEPGREDLIIAGTALTIGVMEMFEFRRMLVSDAGLLEGLLLAASEGGLP
jgi:exopolyphosphatase/guanosine-5'-triphosphate,3'-diphosphate pyrophosphatase